MFTRMQSKIHAPVQLPHSRALFAIMIRPTRIQLFSLSIKHTQARAVSYVHWQRSSQIETGCAQLR